MANYREKSVALVFAERLAQRTTVQRGADIEVGDAGDYMLVFEDGSVRFMDEADFFATYEPDDSAQPADAITAVDHRVDARPDSMAPAAGAPAQQTMGEQIAAALGVDLPTLQRLLIDRNRDTQPDSGAANQINQAFQTAGATGVAQQDAGAATGGPSATPAVGAVDNQPSAATNVLSSDAAPNPPPDASPALVDQPPMPDAATITQRAQDVAQQAQQAQQTAQQSDAPQSSPLAAQAGDVAQQAQAVAAQVPDANASRRADLQGQLDSLQQQVAAVQQQIDALS